ncbi:hypothetical protein BpHYR1_002062 [Brachionus plicatilis]|uniref:Uncharacterized protein n=1 Tax=Brachionus plicatilis TaxID=10195 RepID=A0A3M7QZU8_BRAPC|nr:hypothetical protein BpHYR1_002062 [Brachionus plicatilis]
MKNLDEKIKLSKIHAVDIHPNEFDPKYHFYSKALKHKMNQAGCEFFQMNNEQIILRYSRLKPSVNIDYLRQCLNYRSKFYTWGGCDLFKVVDRKGKKQLILIESNTCASGVKSTPFFNQSDKYGPYKKLVENFMELFEKSDTKSGDLAVIYDQNSTESSGYATCLADLTGEIVWLVQYLDESLSVKWSDGIMYVRDADENWHAIRGCVRLVTQKPWTKIPLISKTIVVNPIITCLAGGRNKNIASYAYKLFNAEQLENSTKLGIREPYTLINVDKKDIKFLVENDVNLNKKAVIKVPYDNCGQGVYTIVNDYELRKFLNTNHNYDKFLVQSLCGNFKWSSGQYFHLGTLPNMKTDEIFAFDVRMLVKSNRNGFSPVSVNFRRARKPLADSLINMDSSWDILGTNLSTTIGVNNWKTDEERLMVMNDHDFTQLGMDIDDLIESYIQTVLAMVAIDHLCIQLYDDSMKLFDFDLFKKINPDEILINEIKVK